MCRASALALENDPVHVQGKVLRLWTTNENNGRHYRVEYAYSAPPGADSRHFQNKTELPKEIFNRLKEDGPIAVKVCRTDASNHQVLGERPRAYLDNASLRQTLGILALLAGAGAINLWWWWVSRREPVLFWSSSRTGSTCRGSLHLWGRA